MDRAVEKLFTRYPRPRGGSPIAGESTKATEGNSPEGRARDLHDLLATLGVTRPVLVGWSQGAQDVAAYVQQFGIDSVAGVVFVDSPVSIGPAEIEEHKEFSKIIFSGIGAPAEARSVLVEMVHQARQG